MKQQDTARKQASKMQDKLEPVYLDSIYYENEMQAKNDQLTDHMKSEMNLLPLASSAVSDCSDDTMVVMFIQQKTTSC